MAVRLHNIGAWRAMCDWDAAGHALNVVDFMELRWPDPRSWCGSHPPLYYLASAVLWAGLPDGVPVHVTMRALSSAAWIATVALVWRTLRALGSTIDAAVAATVLLAIPGLTIASSMMTNDALCALFVTLTLVRLVESSSSPLTMRDVALTAALAGLAAATKATGVAAIGIAGACYAWRERRDPRRAVQALAVVTVVGIAIAGPHYARLFWAVSGSPYDILAARAGSEEKETVATFVHAVARHNNRTASLWNLFHTAIWGDPTKAYFEGAVEARTFTHAVWIAGLVVVPVVLAGVVRACLRRDLWPAWGIVLVFGVAFLAALVPHAVSRPYIVLTKTNYILPMALPLGVVLALGLDAIRGAAGIALRAALLIVAAAAVAFTTYGWWGTPPTAAATERHAFAHPAAQTVVDYFDYRARDPMRALRLLAPDVQLAHGLRMLHVLGLPPLVEPSHDAPADDVAFELGRARVAWLEIQHFVVWIEPIVAAFDVAIVDVAEHGDTTDVTVRIGPNGPTPPPGGEIGSWPFPPLLQRFSVERFEGATRITRVEQSNVVDENAIQAFAAHPTKAGFDHLRALGWQPPLAGVAAAFGMGPK